MSYEHLQLLVQFCPHTRHVNLYVDEDLGHFLAPLTGLNRVHELKLLACNFCSGRVDRLLAQQGHSPLLLQLEHVDQLELPIISRETLVCVSESSPQIVEFLLVQAEI